MATNDALFAARCIGAVQLFEREVEALPQPRDGVLLAVLFVVAGKCGDPSSPWSDASRGASSLLRR